MKRPFSSDTSDGALPLQGCRILVVDDEADVRLFIATVLEDAGAEIFQAEDGEEALLIARAESPDLITLDLSMPGMSGNFVAAMKVWAVDRDEFDLRPLHEFDRQLAEELLGIPLGASQDFAASMFGSPEAQEMIAEFESEMGELRDKEPVSTLTEIYMLERGQDFDPSQAFREPDPEADEQSAGGGRGGLFGGLGAALGGLGRSGGGGSGSQPQSSTHL